MAKPLVVVLGPTASGKSGLSMELAKTFNGELICADSRTVYKGMDIGTAKPLLHDRKEITHHLLDVIEPNQTFSAANFKELALEAIEEINSKDKTPIMVGGTGLYIDSLIYDFAFLPTVAGESREYLETLNVEQLQKKLQQEQIALPRNDKNKRHLIRAIETNGQIPIRKGLRKDTLLIGIDISKEELSNRVVQRLENMITNGLESEVNDLNKKYGKDAPGLSAVGYREWLEPNNTDEDIQQKIKNSTMQYAKRQRTWFRRNEHINWVNNNDQAIKLVQDFLQHYWAK